MILSPGARLGAFEVLSFLGAGGMGEVYAARDTRLDRTVAIKILRSDKIGQPGRFDREARAVSRLSHPHICSLHDIGEQDGTAFLVMEYLEGQTLADRLGDGPLPLNEALGYGIEICSALDQAHEQGVIHRDVKPGNVMLTRDGVKLLDFGLAKLRQLEADDIAQGTTANLQLSTETGIVGTLSYTSPEQLQGQKVDGRTDLFAFGAVLYEMITGCKAFPGESRASVIAAILTSDPPLVTMLQPFAPPALARVVHRCLAKDPAERWQTARDLGWELKRIAQEGEHVASFHRERKGRAVLVGALLGAGVVAAISFGAWILRPETSLPSYHRLTFQRGVISSARFAPDRDTVVFSASWDARPYELFLTRLGSTESRSLGLTDARILSVSPAGEMAILRGPQSFMGGFGTLAQASLAGGLPREVLENVTEADWGRDGGLAVVKWRQKMMELEFPVGTKLHEARSIWSMRVSPNGDRVAFFESDAPGVAATGAVVVVDRSSKSTTLSKPLIALGLAWSPRGDEVWFTGARSDGPPALRAVSLSGKERLVARVPAPLKIDDISGDGRVLVTKGLNLGGINCLVLGETHERELGWLDGARVEGLSADSKTLLFGAREGNWNWGVYTRATDGSPAVRLGDGHPESLSPDGKWVLARAPGAPNAWGREWALVPAGAGSPRLLPRGAITQLGDGAWLPDGKRVVFTAIEQGHAMRGYVQDVETGRMQPLTPEGVRMPEKAATPDGKSVLFSQGGEWFLYPIDGGEPRPVPALHSSDQPLRWSADGRFLYVTSWTSGFIPPVAIERLEVSTGRREPWKTLVPYDPVGVEYLDPPVVSPDGRAYCYSYARRNQELYVVEGLK